MVLRPPVEPMLTQTAEALPGPAVLRAGVAYEQKLDGHRTILLTAAGPGGRVLLQSQRGQDRWPDLVAAADTQLPAGLVLDGELLVWDVEAGRLSFEALQRRAAARARGAPALAASLPAFFVAFDVLQLDGQELLARPYAERRALLENLFAEHGLTAPWTLVPMTTDLAKAREWLQTWTDVSGVEGLVCKGMTTRYLPGYGGWTKIKRRDTSEAIIGAITGTLTRPQLLVLGRHDEHGRLRAVGRTVALRPDQVRQVAEYLTAARPGHPWTGGGAVRGRVGLPGRPGRDPGPPGAGGGDQRRPGHRPGRGLSASGPVHAAAPAPGGGDVPAFGQVRGAAPS
ncbi:ATP-dependent DNA ligase [Streptomyces sp. WAC07149]|uniref:ATP-dependent DNA ligase n=1 Tax=Streptomyces sp. WAC07149 TaxID=2487425 RepID=UPI0021AFF6E8|nr:ATP-dependent DNA ligase [Streptomyces sp. WAC07149]